MSSVQSYSMAVAQFLRAYRKEHDLTLDAVATAGREFGATWGTASVRNIEAGKLAPTLPNLLVLALALGSLTGRPLRLSEVLGDADLLELPTLGGGGLCVRRAWLDRALTGPPLRLSSEDVSWVEGPPPPPGEPGARRVAATLSEQRAAEKLGIEASELQQWAGHLWGRSLGAEAVHRAGADSSPQARGRVTRVLVEEIREALDEAMSQSQQADEVRREIADEWLTDRWPQ